MMTLPQHRHLPGDPSYARGAARMRAVQRMKHFEGKHAEAERASVGRVLYFQGAVPQRDASAVEAVAWYRESGCIPGYRNRHWRRHFPGR